LKKTPWKYVIRGQCCPSNRVWQPSADSNGSLAPFLFEFKLSRSGVTLQPSADNNGAPKGHYYLQRAVRSHPTRSLSRIVCRGQERPKGRKGTLRPDFQASTRPRIFVKKPMSPQDTRRQLWGNPDIVSLRQFRDNEAWIQLGQESPLMNKKGLSFKWRVIQNYIHINEILLPSKSFLHLSTSCWLAELNLKIHSYWFAQCWRPGPCPRSHLLLYRCNRCITVERGSSERVY
jgi:hypothetical protein